MSEQKEHMEQAKEKPILTLNRQYLDGKVIVCAKYDGDQSGLRGEFNPVKRQFKLSQKAEIKDFEAAEKDRLRELLDTGEGNFRFRTFEIVREVVEGQQVLGEIRAVRQYFSGGYKFTIMLEGLPESVLLSNGATTITRNILIEPGREGIHDEADERHLFQQSEFENIVKQLSEIRRGAIQWRVARILKEYIRK